MIDGNFIVIEGVDGAGTTTQSETLRRRFADRGLPAHVTREPSDGPIGALIRQILTSRVVIPGSGGAHSPSWQTMAALFAADRLDHLEAEIMPNLREGVTVICDRYDYSSVAYQSISAGGDPEVVGWVKELNRHARRPDLTIVLDVDAQVAADRRSVRPGAPELYEEQQMQSELGEFYSTIETHFTADSIIHVDGNGDANVVAASIEQHVRTLRGE